MKIAILGTRGIPNNYGGFEQCAEYLSVGLVKKGHDITIYSPHFHPYKKDIYKGVNIIRKLSPEKILGKSASNFFYDYFCFLDATRRDFDIILQLGLITSSLSIVFCRHKGKLVTTNLDGLEWKREKWNKLIQKLTRALEKYGVKYSDYLIADNIAIKDYINKEYNAEAEFIAYGTDDVLSHTDICLNDYGITNKGYYFLSIARLEPENNLEMMLDAYILSNNQAPYYVVGKHTTTYGDFLKDKYRNKGIVFLGAIFNKNDLDNIRYYSKLYIHGHSVGGTNPALLEAMAASCLIAAHDNTFNRSVLSENAFFFSSSSDLSHLFNQDLGHNRKAFISNNFNKINKLYKWPIIIDKYEAYFKKILREFKKQ